MPSNIEYAQLSGSVYTRTRPNRTPIPVGWTPLQAIPDTITGFAAGVFQKGDDIVIAYTGTNEKQVRDFLQGNIPAVIGAPSQRTAQRGQALPLA